MSNPTLAQLNNMSSSQVQLQLLRCLCTSDLSFQYMLLSPASILDIVRNSKQMLQIEEQFDAPVALTSEELEEYKSYCSQLEEYAANCNPFEYALAAMQAITANQFAVLQAAKNSESEDIALCTTLANSFERIAPSEGSIAVDYKDQLHSLRLLATISKG